MHAIAHMHPSSLHACYSTRALPPQCSTSQASELVSFLILFKVSHGPPGGQEALCEECCGGSSIWWAWFRPLLCHAHAMFGANFILYTQNKHLGAGVVAPSEKCLLCRHKNEFHSHTFFFQSRPWWCMLLIRPVGTWRQVDSQSSLATEMA